MHGNHVAFAEMYARLYPKTVRKVTVAGFGDIAEDVVQEALVRAIRCWPKLTNKSDLDSHGGNQHRKSLP